jgi:hypothetical protein
MAHGSLSDTGKRPRAAGRGCSRVERASAAGPACHPIHVGGGLGRPHWRAALPVRPMVRALWALCWLALAGTSLGRRRDGQKVVAPPRLSEHETAALLGTTGVPVGVQREDAGELLALADQALLELRFPTAVQLYRLSASALPAPLPAHALPLMVAAGKGLQDTGEVKLAGEVLRYSLQSAPPRRKLTHESSAALSLALAVLAQSVASDSSRPVADKIASIEAAAKARPPPDLRWYLWAVNTLKFVLGDNARAAALLEKAVLEAPVGSLDLALPSLAQKLRWLVRRLRKLTTTKKEQQQEEKATMSPSAPSASMQAVESRLLEENPLWLAIITSAAADIDAPVGSGGDHWRALDATTSASAGADGKKRIS